MNAICLVIGYRINRLNMVAYTICQEGKLYSSSKSGALFSTREARKSDKVYKLVGSVSSADRHSGKMKQVRE